MLKETITAAAMIAKLPIRPEAIIFEFPAIVVGAVVVLVVVVVVMVLVVVLVVMVVVVVDGVLETVGSKSGIKAIRSADVC